LLFLSQLTPLSDEADVFLEARGEGENNFQRNAMVSGQLPYLKARSFE
jgi:hypothetical protein